MSILDTIIKTKRQEVATIKEPLSHWEALATRYTPKGFAVALQKKPVAIIAEIKQASPSQGIICHDFDPVAIARGYEQSGAACLSVLTDRQYFKGDLSHLVLVRQATSLPLLRKDFMIDPIQIAKACAVGADCILLIMACLPLTLAKELHQYALSLGLDVLIEIHDDDDLQKALTLQPSAHNIYGINNRNLNTFVTDLNTSQVLGTKLTKALGNVPIVSESGIKDGDDIRLLQAYGIHRFLIGEQFMKTKAPAQALTKLLSSVA